MGRYHFEGLSDSEVFASRNLHGTNALPPPAVETFWDKLLDNFKDPLIKILGIALGITLVLAIFGYASWIEGIGIATAVFLATFVATYSEHKNEESFQELQREASRKHANVFRNGGHIFEISANDVVVGDFVLLQPGDIVPADGVLVAGSIISNQVTLTGERNGKQKLTAPGNYDPADRNDTNDKFLVFRGSETLDGEGVLLVKRVGSSTLYGSVADALQESSDRESPLQIKLGSLADTISRLGYIGATCIAVSFMFKQIVLDNHCSLKEIGTYLSGGGVFLHDLVKAVILAIIVIVVAVPEGLPMMIAIVLSLNMKRLLRDKVLVRKLLGIETAGSMSILFADKTGTMTRGQFDPVLFVSGSSLSYRFIRDIPVALQEIVSFAIRESSESLVDSKSGDIVGGNASDQAMLRFLSRDALLTELDVEEEKHIMFNATRKFSATQLRLGQRAAKIFASMIQLDADSRVTLVKGAPEIVLPLCQSFYDSSGSVCSLGQNADPLQKEIDLASRRGIRVIAIATTLDHIVSEHEATSPPEDLTLIGIIGIRDEVRPSTTRAVEDARRAGIQTVMITGDKRETAVAVAVEVGLLDQRNPNLDPGAVITSSDLKRMSDAEVQAIMPKLRVVARALPVDKARLVSCAQAIGAVVGMTGDGVNDTVALRRADVGFAMGSGADVAKEAADIIILDDNFSSITKAVLYGRTIFKSIRKFIVHQSTINLSSTVIVFMGPFLGFDFPLTLIQLLWVNLVMDTLAALAFGGEPPLARYMDERPIERTAPIISPYMWTAIVANGFFIAFLSIFFLTHDWVENLFVRAGHKDHEVFLTAFFCFFIFITNVNAFNVRTHKTNLLENLWDNKNFVVVESFIFLVQIVFTYLGGSWLRTVGLQFHEWFIVISMALLIIPFDLFRKTQIVPRIERHLRVYLGMGNRPRRGDAARLEMV